MYKKIILAFTATNILQMASDMSKKVEYKKLKVPKDPITGFTYINGRYRSRKIEPIAVLNHIYNPKLIQIRSSSGSELSENAKSNLIEIIKKDMYEGIQLGEEYREDFLKQITNQKSWPLVSIENIKNIINMKDLTYSNLGDLSFYIKKSESKDKKENEEIVLECWILAETNENIKNLETLLETTLDSMDESKYLSNFLSFLYNFVTYEPNKRPMIYDKAYSNEPDDKKMFSLDELYTKIDIDSGKLLLDRGLKYLYDKKYIIKEILEIAKASEKDPIECIQKNAEEYDLHEKKDIQILRSILIYSYNIKDTIKIYLVLSNIITELKKGLYSLDVEKENIIEGIENHIQEIPKLYMKKKERLEAELQKETDNYNYISRLMERKITILEYNRIHSKQKEILEKFVLIDRKIEYLTSLYELIDNSQYKISKYTFSELNPSERIYLEKKLENLYKSVYIKEEEEEKVDNPLQTEKRKPETTYASYLRKQEYEKIDRAKNEPMEYEQKSEETSSIIERWKEHKHKREIYIGLSILGVGSLLTGCIYILSRRR